VPKPKNKLTPKQAMFVDEYLKDLNASQAAVRAGYSKKNCGKISGELMAKTHIQREIARRRQDRVRRLELDQNYVIGNLMEVADRCLQHEPVFDKEGNPTGEYQFREQGAIRALELLGKHLALFTDKHEVTGRDGGPIELADARAAVLERLQKP